MFFCNLHQSFVKILDLLLKANYQRFPLKTSDIRSQVVVVAAHIHPSVTGQCQMLTIGRSALFYCNDYYLVIEGIHTCLGISSDPE